MDYIYSLFFCFECFHMHIFPKLSEEKGGGDTAFALIRFVVIYQCCISNVEEMIDRKDEKKWYWARGEEMVSHIEQEDGFSDSRIKFSISLLLIVKLSLILSRIFLWCHSKKFFFTAFQKFDYFFLIFKRKLFLNFFRK